MENGTRITLADLDNLNGGSFERMVQDISKTTRDKKKIEELTTLNILHNFSQRLKADKKEESSSKSNVFARKEVERKQGLEENGFRVWSADHDIDRKHEGDGKDGRKEFLAANSAEEKRGRKIIKIRKRKHYTGRNIESTELGLDSTLNLPVYIREIVAWKEDKKKV